jgi:hypothetical protein
MFFKCLNEAKLHFEVPDQLLEHAGKMTKIRAYIFALTAGRTN